MPNRQKAWNKLLWEREYHRKGNQGNGGVGFLGLGTVGYVNHRRKSKVKDTILRKGWVWKLYKWTTAVEKFAVIFTIGMEFCI